MNQLTIGKFIAQKRKEKNLTQEQLSEKLGVSTRPYQNGNAENVCLTTVL